MPDLFRDYRRRNLRFIGPVADLALAVVKPFSGRPLSGADTSGLFAALWSVVNTARYESGQIARDYYDAEREARTGLTERHLFLVDSYSPEKFGEAVSPSLAAMTRAPEAVDTPRLSREAVDLAAAAVKEVQNGGRLTIIEGAKTDPEAAGWARVGTGSSCAFCTMLISRGPVYESQETAQGMTAYHAGCDCRAVPVFDRRSWPGRDQFLAAERLWIDATRGKSGQDAINAFRHAVEGGGDNNERRAA